MADFALPALSDTYANFLQLLKDRDSDVAVWFDGTTSPNIPTGSKGWDGSNFKFLKWSGTAWVDLAVTYQINVLKLGGFPSGHATANIPISDGTLNVTLNADQVDGHDAGTGANNVLLLDGSGKVPASVFPAVGTAGTFQSVTVGADGRVTAGTNPTTRAGYGITDVPLVNGTSATGTWAISITGLATTATDAVTATRWFSGRTITLGNGLRGYVTLDGSANVTLNAQLAFGAAAATGVANWNDATNVLAGFGPRLMTTNDTNGPGYGTAQAHVMNVEYSTKDGSGNITQFSIPYSTDSEMTMRTRQSGTWSAWRIIMSSTNVGTYAALPSGTNATGTWPIGITGNAATASNATNSGHATNAATLDAGGASAGGYTMNGTLSMAGANVHYWPAYGGGWQMVDSVWMRAYNNKNIYTGGIVRGDGGITAGTGQQFNVDSAGAVSTTSTVTAGGQVFGNGGTKGWGRITTTTVVGTPSGGSAGDFVFVY